VTQADERSGAKPQECPAELPLSRGRVVQLDVAAERHGAMQSRESVDVHAGAGVVGDRWYGSRHRHVTVQSVEDLEVASGVLGRPIDPGTTRRNVTVSGLEVPTEPGARLTVGGVVLEVVRVASPCRLMEDSIGPGGHRALRHRGGSVFRALTSGQIRTGDTVHES
jgi:MOSC domain-containing protein YiiM